MFISFAKNAIVMLSSSLVFKFYCKTQIIFDSIMQEACSIFCNYFLNFFLFEFNFVQWGASLPQLITCRINFEQVFNFVQTTSRQRSFCFLKFMICKKIHLTLFISTIKKSKARVLKWLLTNYWPKIFSNFYFFPF